MKGLLSTILGCLLTFTLHAADKPKTAKSKLTSTSVEDCGVGAAQMRE